jgi:hypothetical protein
VEVCEEVAKCHPVGIPANDADGFVFEGDNVVKSDHVAFVKDGLWCTSPISLGVEPMGQ